MLRLNWPRKHLAPLLHAKSGHGDFEAYHIRFGHPERAKACHLCREAPTSRLHLLECPVVELSQRRFLVEVDGPRVKLLKPQEALEHPDAFLAYAVATGAFERQPSAGGEEDDASRGFSAESEEDEREPSTEDEASRSDSAELAGDSQGAPSV